MLLAIASCPLVDDSSLVEAVPEPVERGMQYLRDAALGQVQYLPDLPQRQPLEVVGSGDHPFFFAEAFRRGLLSPGPAAP